MTIHSCRSIRRFKPNHPIVASWLIATCVVAHAAASETLSEKLKRQTQEFSDAGHTGDKAVLDRYLDPEVVFVDEDGSVSGKKDILDGAHPPPAGVTMSIHVTDWQMHRHGDVAVASFVDDLAENFHGQTLDFKYRSIEVWKQKGTDWRMISSETLTLPEDPRAIHLTPEVLHEYVGTYQVAPELIIKISLQSDRLFVASNDGAPSEMKVEVRDVLFTPGRSGRKVFQRDSQGRVTGYFSRLDGRDILVKKVS
jgi:ketosteroid isomerase-like protein